MKTLTRLMLLVLLAPFSGLGQGEGHGPCSCPFFNVVLTPKSGCKGQTIHVCAQIEGVVNGFCDNAPVGFSNFTYSWSVPAFAQIESATPYGSCIYIKLLSPGSGSISVAVIGHPSNSRCGDVHRSASTTLLSHDITLNLRHINNDNPKSYLGIDLYDQPDITRRQLRAIATFSPAASGDFTWNCSSNLEFFNPSNPSGEIAFVQADSPSAAFTSDWVRVSKLCASATGRVTVVKVNVTVPGLDEQYEEAPGHLMGVSTTGPGPLPDDDMDLLPVHITAEPVITGQNVYLTGHHNMYEDRRKETRASSMYPMDQLPPVLYFGTDNPGAHWVSASHPQSGARDRVKITVIKVELTSIDDYNSWMPELNNTIRFMANIQPPNLQGFFDFRLTDVSQHPGYCMNAPNPVPNSGKHSASWNDLRFLTPQPGISVSGSQDNIGTSTIKNSEQEIVIISHDYASWGNLRCTAEIGISPGNAMFFDTVFSVDGKSFAKIPKDDNANDIADAWEHSSGAPTDDLDEFPGLSGNPNIGDGLSRFQEYRGFLTAAGPVERLNPGRPNLFVWNKDQLPVTEFASASKLDLVLIAGAGHDATKRVNFATGGQPGRPDYHLKNQYAVTLIRIPGLGGGLWDSTTLEASVGEDQHPAGIVRVTGHELGHAVNLKHHHADPVFSSDEDRRYNGPACYMKYSCSFEDYLPQNLVFCACATPSPGCTNFEDVTPCYPGEHPLTTTDCLSGRCACILKIKVNPINKWNVNFPD